MASRHTISIAKLSNLGRKEIFEFILRQFPRYTPTEVNRKEPKVYAFLGGKIIRTAIRQGILREDYTIGWENEALIVHVITHYNQSPLKRIRQDNPLLANELQRRKLLESLLERGIVTGKRPPRFFENMDEEKRKTYVVKNFKGYSLTQLREKDQTFYRALSKRERTMLVNEKILVQKKREKCRPKSHERKVFGVRQTMMQTASAAEDANIYATTSGLPSCYEPYSVAEEHIWHAMNSLHPRDHISSNKKTNTYSFVHQPLDERLRWGKEQGMFGEV